MLISPPFLPTRLDNETEEAWLNRAFEQVVGEGMYPVGGRLCWHGGIHLNAPANAAVAGQFLPVRAIADGSVVFLRRGETTRSDDPNHVLNYDGQNNRAWTSDGCVVIEHNTEIGADAQNNPVAVRFYSVYMHLMNIPTTVQQGRAIYRKDSLGEAGYICGEPNRLHFEIACDAANLQNFIGRSTGDLPITQDGRSTVVFGELYFHLPAGTPIYAQKPLDNSATAVSFQPPRPTPNAPLPAVQALTVLPSTATPCIIGMRYACGEGAVASRGDLTVSTYLENGMLCGTALREAEYEYKLYNRAKEISDAYPATGRPAPSAVLELLRFGRIINTAHETLTPNDVPHWREITIPTADCSGRDRGWVNLNNLAQGQVVRRFSDADFPQWARWRVFDDDLTAGDSRCESAAFKTLLDIDRNGNVTPDERRARMQDPAVLKAASHAICAMPSEWNAADIDVRWSWLKTVTEENPQALSEEDFAGFSAHVRALCVAAPALHAATYRFHPRAFVETFRQCEWLSARELAQCIPRTSLMGNTPWATALTRGENHRVRLSKMFMKYGARSASRKIHFLSQIYIETGLLRTMREGGQGAPNPNLPKAQYYAAFYGRGYMQLTWASNYSGYGTFRSFANNAGNYTDARITTTSTHVWADFNPATQQPNYQTWSPRYDPDDIADDEYACADSGGYYWISKTYRGTSDITRVVDIGMEPRAIGFVSWLVNGGGNGYADRHAFARYLFGVLDDTERLTGTEAWLYPRLNAQLTGTFPPGNPPNTLTVQVNHARQIPAP